MDDDALNSKNRRELQWNFSEILNVLQSITQENRLRILTTLLDQDCEFQELQYYLNIRKTALANHLRILLSNYLIHRDKRGHYSIASAARKWMDAITKSYRNSKSSIIIEENQSQNDSISEKPHELKNKMENVDVKIESLPPMRIASVRIISETPEMDAANIMNEFAQKHQLLEDIERNPIFGFDNPEHTPEKKEHGYEFWIKIDPSITETGTDLVKIKEFPGGLYAVKRCNLSKESQSEYLKKHGALESWHLLQLWVEQSKYSFAEHQWLEKHCSSDFILTEKELLEKQFFVELHYPIKRKSK
jgi:DNA gyrase inhibitor GyrI/DNA-binding HxlR family transcriptional regulator